MEEALTAVPGNVALDDVNQAIDDGIKFQRRWQLASMTFYVAAAATQLGEIMQTYAATLPVEARGN